MAPLEDNQFLARLFGPDVPGRLPTTGQEKIQHTALSLPGEFGYEFAPLTESTLCLPAANVLRDL